MKLLIALALLVSPLMAGDKKIKIGEYCKQYIIQGIKQPKKCDPILINDLKPNQADSKKAVNKVHREAYFKAESYWCPGDPRCDAVAAIIKPKARYREYTEPFTCEENPDLCSPPKTKPKPLTTRWIIVRAYERTEENVKTCSKDFLITSNGFYCKSKGRAFDIELGLRSDHVVVWR